MLTHSARIWFAVVACIVTAGLIGDASADQPDSSERRRTWIPADETQAAEFRTQHPEADGRGIRIAIFDTGVDPGALGMQQTTTGEPKVIDLIDGTGAGDVEMRRIASEALDGPILGIAGRPLKLRSEWRQPNARLSVGFKAGYELFPREVVSKLRTARQKEFQAAHSRIEASLLSPPASPPPQKDSPPQSSKSPTRLVNNTSAELLQLAKSVGSELDDPGPVFNCVTFHDGRRWRAIVDTDQDDDLTDELVLENFALRQRYATFPGDAPVNFALNVYDEGKLLSIVVDSGAHGTHVASIAAGHVPGSPESSGVAPGAQLISVKIGDHRVGGMETGLAIRRGLRAVERHGCHLVNMSFGEPTATPLAGQIVEDIERTVREYGVVFVSSAMNSGPALSTVGAPGGTGPGVLGVGAYISPQMARESYAAATSTPEAGYVWTSRGPAHDGSLGVDLFAPGGAYAAVPEWSGQRVQRMNGTSMASPNACGCLALMLSAAKGKGVPWTPQTVLRAVQSTARSLDGVDPWTQGPGLIQTLAAAERLLAIQQQSADLPPLRVRVSHPSRPGRGLYLREAAEVGRSAHATVAITPQLTADQRSQWKDRLPLLLTLRSTAEWVQVGAQVIVPSNGQSFAIDVDCPSLPPGAHFAEIQAFDPQHEELGPVLRIPVTVLRHHEQTPPANSLKLVSGLDAGQQSRWFLDVPPDVHRARVTIRRLQKGSHRRIVLHAMQLQENEPFRRTEQRRYLTLSDQSEITTFLDLVAGCALELCLAQDWSSTGMTELELTCEWLPLEAPSFVDVSDTQGATNLRLGNLRQVPLTWNLKAELTEQQKRLLPTRTRISPRDSSRDNVLVASQSARPVEYDLELEYSLRVPRTATIGGVLSGHQDLLYESPWGGYLWHIHDEHGRIVHSGDIFPSTVRLTAGEYTIHVILRHAELAQLRRAETSAFIVSCKLPSPIPVPLYRSRVDAARQVGSISSLHLEAGERRWLTAASPAILSQAQLAGRMLLEAGPGDTLAGHMTLTEQSGDKEIWRTIPVQASTTTVSKPSAAAASRTTNRAVQRLESLAPDRLERFERLYRQLSRSRSSKVEVDVAALHWLDHDQHRKQRLQRIVDVADHVIGAIDRAVLRQELFGSRQLPSGGSSRTDSKKQLNILVDALYRKGRALGYMELPDVVALHPIDDPQWLNDEFEATVRELDSWVDLSDEKYLLLRVRFERRRGHQAVAIKLLDEAAKKYGDHFWYDKKRRDLYAELGWSHVERHFENWLIRRYPNRMQQATAAQHAD